VIDDQLRLALVGRPAEHHGAETDLRHPDAARSQHAIRHFRHGLLLLRGVSPSGSDTVKRPLLEPRRQTRRGLTPTDTYATWWMQGRRAACRRRARRAGRLKVALRFATTCLMRSNEATVCERSKLKDGAPAFS